MNLENTATLLRLQSSLSFLLNYLQAAQRRLNNQERRLNAKTVQDARTISKILQLKIDQLKSDGLEHP